MIPGRRKEQIEIEHDVSIDLGKVTLQGILGLPVDAKGIVLFAHGSGSGRLSPRNQFVAEFLQSRGMATLLFDLLTAEEEAVDQRTMLLRFSIRLLARRLVGATRWSIRNPETEGLNIGYFGASTGAAAALQASAQLPGAIAAIVSRGGRPDLAGDALASPQPPTLCIVGGIDEPVIALNERALDELRSPEKKLVIVPGATHLFEETGALAEVASISADWFAGHFAAAGNPRRHLVSQRG